MQRLNSDQTNNSFSAIIIFILGIIIMILIIVLIFIVMRWRNSNDQAISLATNDRENDQNEEQTKNFEMRTNVEESIYDEIPQFYVSKIFDENGYVVMKPKPTNVLTKVLILDQKFLKT